MAWKSSTPTPRRCTIWRKAPAGRFSPAELDELRALLGLYGLELDKRLPPSRIAVAYVEQRQQYWSEIGARDRDPVRVLVAERAVSRYGHILDELLGTG